jgi:type IV pilus assembly protein PilV
VERLMPKRPRRYDSRHRQGFTLLEVLIALLILSIGLLGLAALQTVGMRSNQMAVMRTHVSHVAYEITDRMRANPVGVTNGDYDIAVTDPKPTSLPNPLCDARVPGTDAPCTTAEMATFDLNQWLTAILEGLPGGDAEITYDAITDVHTITVYWNEARDPDAAVGNCPPQNDSDFRCYRLVFQG